MEVEMAGTVALAGVALLATVFFTIFLAALLRERRHVKVCILLRQKPGEGQAQVRSVQDGKPPAPVIVLPDTRAAVSQVWSKVG